MIVIQIDYVAARVLQPKINTSQGTFRDFQIVVSTFRIVEEHLVVIGPHGYLLYYHVASEIGDGVEAS